MIMSALFHNLILPDSFPENRKNYLFLSGGLDFCSCSPPDLSAGSANGNTSGLASAADDSLSAGGSALAGDAAGGSSPSAAASCATSGATSSHL